MSESDIVETPSQALARQIVERLVKERIISAAAAVKLQQQLADGKLRAEDWRLPIELGPEREARS